jgi:formamidopyrimidine-DNA glycosylase
MPELPEVETIRRYLVPRLVGRRITAVRFGTGHVKTEPGPSAFRRLLYGARVRGIGRCGKYLAVRLDKGRELIVHLGMSGRILLARQEDAEKSLARHERARLDLSGGLVLSFFDPRRFGRLWVKDGVARQPEACGIGRLGIEPLESDYTAEYLGNRLKGRNTPVKNLLLDQRIACGAGNIYSDEALFAARIRPTRTGASLNRAETASLASALRRVLKDGIRWCGTTMKDGGYVLPDGRTGSFQDRLRVYGRAGRRCLRPRCRGLIERVRLGGRSSHYCPLCQN